MVRNYHALQIMLHVQSPFAVLQQCDIQSVKPELRGVTRSSYHLRIRQNSPGKRNSGRDDDRPARKSPDEFQRILHRDGGLWLVRYSDTDEGVFQFHPAKQDLQQCDLQSVEPRLRGVTRSSYHLRIRQNSPGKRNSGCDDDRPAGKSPDEFKRVLHRNGGLWLVRYSDTDEGVLQFHPAKQDLQQRHHRPIESKLHGHSRDCNHIVLHTKFTRIRDSRGSSEWIARTSDYGS